MAVFLYAVCFIAIFLSAFGVPFATRRVPVAVIFVVSSLVLLYGGYLMAGFTNNGPYASDNAPRLSFLMVLALSVLPFAAGALARLITLMAFKSDPNKLAGVVGVGAATTVLYGAVGWLAFGLF